MNEQELLAQLAEVDLNWLEAKRKLAQAKKMWTDTETEIIELKLKRDNLTEALRVFRKTDPIQPPSLRDLEIERFRKDNPEVCALAKERDSVKEK
jgi:hypothetical protein